MSQRNSSTRRRLRRAGLCMLAGVVPGLGAQTIADYSRVQRAALESAMTQAAARSAAVPASTPGTVTPAPAVAPSQMQRPPQSPVPTVQVSGVFATSASAIAEVAVDRTAYLLAAGQGVPGTAWRVESVAVDRVVLNRRVPRTPAGAEADAPESARRVFVLPQLR